MKVSLRTNFAGRDSLAEAELSYYSQQNALMKGVQTLAICWIVALICVLVPVLHFVLTPAALLAGPIAGTLVYYKTQKLPKRLEGAVACLHCSQPTTFLFENTKPPFYDMCKSCKTPYEILWPPVIPS